MASEITPHYFAVNEVLTAEKLNKLCAALIELDNKITSTNAATNAKIDMVAQQVAQQRNASNILTSSQVGGATSVEGALAYIAQVFIGNQTVKKLCANTFDARD